MINDKQMSELYLKVIKSTAELVNGYDPLAVAAIMMTQALSIYRSTLSEDDYNAMVQAILDKKDQIQTFGSKGTLH